MTDLQRIRGQYLEARATMEQYARWTASANLRFVKFPRWQRAMFFWRFLPIRKKALERQRMYYVHKKIAEFLADSLRFIERRR